MSLASESDRGSVASSETDAYSKTNVNVEKGRVPNGDLKEANIDDISVVGNWDPDNVKTIEEDDLELIAAHLDDRTTEEWLEILRKLVKYHGDDEVVPLRYRKFLADLLDGPLEGMTEHEWRTVVAFETFLIYEWSIYPEVRMATRPIDEIDPDDYENIRTYLIGTLWACAGCVLDTFFEVRLPAITLGFGACQLLIAGSGHLWARLPRIVMPIGRGKKWVLNSGHEWTFKEQVFASLIMAVSIMSPYSQPVVNALSNKNFYGYTEGGTFGFIIMLTLATSFLGFGLTGMYRAFNVYPTKMVWYDILPNLQMNRILAGKDHRYNINGWRLTRHEAFWLFSWLNFGWFWVTNLAFPALSLFTWIEWIRPDSVGVQNWCGSSNGLGFDVPVVTWDTNVITFTSLYTPFSMLINFYSGYVISMLAIVVIWYTNVRGTGYFPINSQSLYDNTGLTYDVSQVLDSNLHIDLEKLRDYSYPYFSAGNLVNYGSLFMFYPAMISFMLLNYWSMMADSFKGFWRGLLAADNLLESFDSRFTRAQRKYKEVPEWWYAIMLVVSFGFSVALVEHYRFTETPVWTIVLGLGLSIIFLYPSNVFRARTTYFFDVGTLYEMIIGYALEGNGVGMMVSKCIANAIGYQSDNWVNQLAMAHYTGISQRRLFRAQLVSVISTSFVMSGVITWQASGALGPTFCTYDSVSKFYCPNERTTFNAAIQWGTIGPRLVFKHVYPQLKWCFLIGAVYPIPLWTARKFMPMLAKKFPEGSFSNRVLKVPWLFQINEMVVLNAASQWAPYNWYYNLGNLEIGVFWHKYIKPKFPAWWSRYTFVFYNGVSVGVAFAALFNFFATEYKHMPASYLQAGSPDAWWGVNVTTYGLDAAGGVGRLQLAPGQYFDWPPGQIPIN